MFSKMPWASGHDEKPQQEEGESLTTVLTSTEERTNLLLLIANCTESMRKTLCATFDPQQTNRQSPPKPDPASGGSNDAQATQKEAELLEQQRKEQQNRVQELSAPQMQELKKAALAYFDEWRDRVLERVGENVNQKPSAADLDKHAKAEAARSVTKTIDQTTKDEKSSTALNELYTPQSTPLANFDEAKRVLILHSLLLLVLSLERYPSESRVLLLQITSSLRLPLSALTDDETKVARGLLEAAKQQMNADDETKKKAAESSSSRAWKIGLGTVAGAAIIGVTGGLAAPLLAAGVGSVMGGLGLGSTVAATYLGAMAGSAPLVGVLFGAYGGRMTGQSIERYAKEISDFAFLPVHKQQHHSLLNKREASQADTRRLRVAIGISGWLTSQEDIVKPWLVVAPSTEAFALRFELDAMMSLGNALLIYVKSYAWGWAKKELISRTVFGALSAALWPLGLLKVAKVVDNPFSIAKTRSEKAGEVLADALINKVQGERPVTLIGYSLGARVIYSCLLKLADRKAFGLIESVILLGAPTPSDAVAWRKMRAVVAGRVVNVYSTQDYLLAFLYRTGSLQLGVAGLQAVDGVPGVENVDVSGFVDGHTRYRYLTGSVLKKIGFEDVDVAEVERQESALKVVVEAEKKEQQEKAKEQEEEAHVLEKEVEEKKRQGMMGWVEGAMSSMGIGGAKGPKGKSEEQMSEAEKLEHAAA